VPAWQDRPVLLVGLTGGIGSGKSVVARLLAGRGAVVIDADAITRELQAPGTPVFDAIVERFGDSVVAADGTLDRARLAVLVFSDPPARRDLEAIVHPAVASESRRRVAEFADGDRIVVYDVPLLVEAARSGFDRVVVVDVDPEVAVRRLVEQRGMSESDIRSRIASQASREDRLSVADRVIDNSGSLDDLATQVDELWNWLLAAETEKEQTR
jgi:dephospho-CoA kinase